MKRTFIITACIPAVCTLFLPAPASAGPGAEGEKAAPVIAAAPTAAPGAGSAAARKADPREVFARANRFYEEGKYARAREEYERLVEKGYESANLFYNLGNACFKLDRKGEAILYYRKALVLWPRDQDAKSNLDYALSLIEDRIEPAPLPWVVRRWNSLVGAFSGGELTAAAVSLYWILCALVITSVYLPGARRPLSRAIGIAALLFAAAAAAAFSRAYIEGRTEAVVLPAEVTVRYGPSERDVKAFVLHEGAVVGVKNKRGGWCQICLPDGKSGWLRKESVGII